MKRQTTTYQESEAALRLEYIMAAAWYWLRAEGADENLVSVCNRMKAMHMQQRFNALRLPLPSDEEIYAYARERWPKHKLHLPTNAMSPSKND